MSFLFTTKLKKHRPQVDRFVLPRESIPDRKIRLFTVQKCDENCNIWNKKYVDQKKYMKYLDAAFGLDSIKYPECDSKGNASSKYCVKPWPCRPRKRRYLKSADSILDLPTYSYANFPELLDWSKDNVLVAALGRNYHKWSWQTQNLIGIGSTRHQIMCCKFDPRGELLALGTKNENIEIHDNKLNKCVKKNVCYFRDIKTKCSITAIDWSPTGNSFVTGCSKGTLTSFTRNGFFIKSIPLVGTIFLIKVSPNARYVAVAAVNGFEVVLFSWPDLKFYSILHSSWTIKNMAWHPWKTALLSVGTTTKDNNAHIVLYDAPTYTVQEISISRDHYSLDAMLFSHRTGELVISLWNTDALSRRRCSQLIVMSDLKTVVDQWGESQTGLDRVKTMVFSPDGTKLATATSGEDLIIWNFLPDDDKKKKINKDKHYMLPVYLDISTQGFSVR